MLDFKEAVPLSLYVHLPWCLKKCPYCDFNSHERNVDVDMQLDYVDALVRDLEFDLPRIWGRQIVSVFIGGGTPSLFSVEAIDRLLAALRARLNLHPGIEVSMEANPGTAEAEKFKGYRDAGINRLSLGIQSLNDDHLKALGRIHDSHEALAAVEIARAAGFDNLNLDIMFGLPGQDTGQALSDLQQAIELKPAHISWYQLTLEPNTVFHARPPALPDDDLTWEMQEAGQALLAENGYIQYEISAYAQNTKRCEHNLNYWEFGDYLGIGAGAHGKLTNVAEGRIERFSRHRLPARYLELAGSEQAVTTNRVLTRAELPLEFMLNAMRLVEGVPTQLFLQRTGMPLTVIDRELDAAEKQGLLHWNVQQLAPTDKGQRYLNNLLSLFMEGE
ncbi:MAG: radical SAM family heme chaperone HemW [Gammaproteobacteria bacterium]